MAEDGETLQSSSFTKIYVDNADDDDSGITMVDVLEEEQELENDATAVLGGSDDQNCTYPQGYVKRQALYACKTCTADQQILAGVCLACSYACHEGHELLELYTKRNFCCDCGNSKFPNNPCKLFPNKNPLNEGNSYNQNFRGLYCSCSRPYPDPENEVEDEMIQCIICEDWYHGGHLATSVPDEQDYGEMICDSCMKECDFLWSYAHDLKRNTHVKIEKSDAGNSSVIDVETVKEEPIHLVENTSQPVEEDDGEQQRVLCKENVEITDNSTQKKEIPETNLCKLEANTGEKRSGATFWPDGWREKLCICNACMAMYKKKGMKFLLDSQDTVHAYEEQGKAKQTGLTQYDQGLQALSNMDRVSQVEAIHEYNSMKTQLKDYLKTFAEKKKLVRKEDIDEFFTQMQERKKRRMNVNIPQFCR